jgi:6-phospho-beta-glucosidase
MVVDILNNGTISCLPDNACIETTCIITSGGPIPLQAGKFSISATAELQILKAFEQLTIEAAIKGDYGIALQALTINPLVESGKKAKEVLDRIIVENIKYLPQFKKYYEENLI